MARYTKQAKLNLAQQEERLKRVYGNLIDYIKISSGTLICDIRLQPSLESRVYKIQIKYKLDSKPQARILDPKEIVKVNGKKPHHLYDRDKDGRERLCVYYRDEWKANMFLSDTFAPWIITWLSAYEYWQITGIWVYPEIVRKVK